MENVREVIKYESLKTVTHNVRKSRSTKSNAEIVWSAIIGKCKKSWSRFPLKCRCADADVECVKCREILRRLSVDLMDRVRVRFWIHSVASGSFSLYTAVDWDKITQRSSVAIFVDTRQPSPALDLDWTHWAGIRCQQHATHMMAKRCRSPVHSPIGFQQTLCICEKESQTVTAASLILSNIYSPVQ